MHRHRESFTKEQFDKTIGIWRRSFNNYYDKYLHSWNKIVALERNIKNVCSKWSSAKRKIR